jgi:hypothetical protein
LKEFFVINLKKSDATAIDLRGEEGSRIMTASEIYEAMRKRNSAALRGTTVHAFSRLLPSMGRKIRTKYCNGYCVVRL